MRSHATPKPHQCDQCEKGFVNSSSLLIHKKTHTERDQFPCRTCEKQFKSATLLAEHELTHTDTHLYQCSICRDKFKESCELVQHMKNHTGRKPFKCSICTKTFTQPGALKVHTRIHLEQKPLLMLASSVTAHQNTHTVNAKNRKSFKCPHCSKSYTNKSYLKRHKCHQKGTDKSATVAETATTATAYACK